MSRLEIQEREVLARALFDLFRRQTCIYHSERDNGEAWAASADDRRLWHERAQEMADTVLAPIGWKPPSERTRLREKVDALRGIDLRPPLAKDGYLLAVKDVLSLLAEPGEAKP